MGDKLTQELLNELLFTKSLDDYLCDNEFSEYNLSEHLNQLITLKKLKKSEVIKKSKLNATFAYQIFSGERQATRNKILQLAFGMKLEVMETQRLLRAAGVNELYCKNRRDAIIIYCLAKKMMLEDADDTLFNFNENLISENQ